MAQGGYSRRWFELAVIALVLALVLWQGAGYYRALVVDAQGVAVQMQADSFERSLVALNAYWQVKYRPGREMEIGEYWLALNAQGWPVAAARERQSLARIIELTDRQCRMLHEALIYVPYSDNVSPSGAARSPSALLQFESRATAEEYCRFRLAGTDEPLFYFEYRPKTGTVAVAEPLSGAAD